MARKIDIRREGDRWMVIRDKPDKFPRGETVEWTLHAPPKHTGELSAHFQFTDADVFLKDPSNQGRLTRDLTADISKPGEKLTLQITEDADRRKNPRHYAVWIMDSTGGSYAVGESGNPPPEMQIGP